MKDFALWYFVFINALSAFICCADKIKAKKHARRVSEKTLWLLSLLGGSAGMYLTMHIIRHKTLHKSFMIGIPLIIIFQIILLLLLTKAYHGHIMLW